MITLKVVTLFCISTFAILGANGMAPMDYMDVEHDLAIPGSCQETIHSLTQLLQNHHDKPLEILNFIMEMLWTYKQCEFTARLLQVSLHATGLSLCQIVDNQGSSILHYACDEQLSLDCIEILFLAHNNPCELMSLTNQHNETVFHIAAFWGLDDHIKMFLHRWQDHQTLRRLLKCKDWQHETPVDVAKKRGRAHVATTLLGWIWHEKCQRLLANKHYYNVTDFDLFIAKLKQQLLWPDSLPNKEKTVSRTLHRYAYPSLYWSESSELESTSSCFSSHSNQSESEDDSDFASDSDIALHEIRNEKNQTLLHLACKSKDAYLTYKLLDAAYPETINHCQDLDQLWQLLMAQDDDGKIALDLADDDRGVLNVIFDHVPIGNAQHESLKNSLMEKARQFIWDNTVSAMSTVD